MKRNRTRELALMAEAIDRDIREIRETLRRPLEAQIARGRITGPQRSVMQVVFQSDGISLKELCQRVSLSHSTASGIVDRLVARGMLERRVNSTDRRFTRIVVTRIVRDFAAKKMPSLIVEPLGRALEAAQPADRKSILQGLGALGRVIGISPTASTAKLPPSRSAGGGNSPMAQ